MLHRLLIVIACMRAAAAASAGVDTPSATYDRVTIEPTKTSIYVGTVSLTMPAFKRRAGSYESTYSAKVFPYFFANEKGTIAIVLPDESLLTLARGEVTEFSGRAVNANGEARRVEGKATPSDPISGKIKVRVFVSKKIELIFNTSYRFEK